ncbi:universal stress protein [Pontibacter qinzhouensis]|uniref:Universal stress protein n=1 Tax=Pontibacter qinzhouensis TaxID=2603253 RepID=A0A5C8JIW6_9BACT|nr:universal stress protein [Pontibacter qinzhouensis]TXK36863.1 universal stress protein [Pontibacter qinzhouensis]
MVTFLCTTDFSASSENAIRYASELAQFFDARILLFHSVSTAAKAKLALAYSSEHDRLTDELEERIDHLTRLEALKTKLNNKNTSENVRYELCLRYGTQEDTIPALLAEEQVDVVVMGHDGAGGLQEVLVGSVAASVTAATVCPVLLIPPGAAFKSLFKIVYASDLKNAPLTGLNFLLRLATLFRSEIMILHVLSSKTDSDKEKLLEELKLYYSRFPFQNISIHLETHRSVQAGISQFTHHNKADMLVVGYHPKEKWDYIFPQNQRQEISYHSYLPMLVMHCTL